MADTFEILQFLKHVSASAETISKFFVDDLMIIYGKIASQAPGDW